MKLTRNFSLEIDLLLEYLHATVHEATMILRAFLFVKSDFTLGLLNKLFKKPISEILHKEN